MSQHSNIKSNLSPNSAKRFRDFQDRYRSGQWRAEVFRDMILDECIGRKSRPVMLDIGCGSGFDGSRQIQREIAKVAATYIGIEPDPNMEPNDHFTRVQKCTFEECDLESDSVDIAFCVMVLEHIRSPEKFWNKLVEILRPGGVFWGFTMDRRHYFCNLSMLTERIRIKDRLLNMLRGERGRDRYENYETYYRANTPAQILENLDSETTTSFVNFDRVGQLDYYFPKLLIPVAHGVDRIRQILHLPGSLLAVRVEKPDEVGC